MRPSVLSCAVLLALSACDSRPTVIESGSPDDQQAALARAKPVKLPPAIASSKTYRCADNALVYVDWLADGSAQIRTGKTGAFTALPAPTAAATPVEASGFSLKGTKDDAKLMVGTPAHPKPQSCSS